ncbi:DUF368 domain-containing protein [Sutcliffiella cohnii]|uniref:DUF368 domain-containing protein n=1 Tax=Sutcliffiella cohnii TaxID=33932 RepID=A0A223KPY7_9BACI|nr:DUF368 domain-containing protein [Sutcliffiella cohnii]AST91585.1 DUF368 domain-containing protein [Sutcliffiella cohnii]MED4014837.1 DUF368 domain-containing protein [Sutcliffiella cohnii]
MLKQLEWKNLFRGMLMGITELVPGVSSGTLAFILGIYDRLINAISGFFSKEWKAHISFLIPLGIGMVISLKAFSSIINYFLEYHYQPTQFLFLGLIIGILPLLYRESDMRNSFGGKHYLILFIAMIPVILLEFFRMEDAGAILVIENISTFGYIFLSGWLASMAMLLPGISGSLVLVILGTYATATTALEHLNFPIIITFGLGVVVGFIISSKIIKFLLNTFPKGTFASIIGLVIGSTYAVFPGLSSSMLTNIVSTITFIVGFFLVQFIGKKNKGMQM